MPTVSKTQKAVLTIQECAKIAMAAGINYPTAEGEAVAAYRALNALAEKIKGSVPARKANAEKQEGGE